MYLSILYLAYSITLCVTFVDTLDFYLENGVVSNEDVLRQIVKLSATGCQRECIKHGKMCSGFGLKRSANLCVLYKASSREVKHTSDPGYVYGSASNWPTFASSCSLGCNVTQTCEPSASTNGLQCVTTYCDDPLPVPYGRILGNMNHVGAERRYVCNGGSYGDGTDTERVQCLSKGEWSRQTLQCLPFKTVAVDVFPSRKWLPYTQNQTDINKSTCGKHCHDIENSCSVFFYNTQERTCTTSLITLSSRNTVHAPGWEAVQKVFPVFHSRPGQEPYQMTFKEAQQHCESLSTTLAAKQDLLVAFNMGYSLCACGFADDGKIYIVMNFKRTECLDLGVNQCRWLSKADAFCKNYD